MKKALLVSLVVGSMLTAINQFEALVGEAQVSFPKLILTYVIPFCVFLWGRQSSMKTMQTEFSGISVSEQIQSWGEARQAIVEISEISNEMGSLATSVNQASQSRLDVATKTQQSTEQSARSLQSFDDKIQGIYQHVVKLSEDTDSVLASFEDMIDQVVAAARWSETHGESIHRFQEEYSQVIEITEGISDISNTTRLLSLNAAIEAAKAGDRGRGFSVVADEIKNLSGHTATKTKSIKAILTNANQFVHDIKANNHELQTSLLSAAEGAADGQGGVRALKSEFANALDTAQALVQDVLQLSHELSRDMSSIESGMQTLLEGAQAAIKGSSQNISYSEMIQARADDASADMEAFISKLCSKTPINDSGRKLTTDAK